MESEEEAACDEEEREEEENKTDPGQTLQEATFRGGGLELGQLGVTERTRAETQQSLHLKQSQTSAWSVLSSLYCHWLVVLILPHSCTEELRTKPAGGDVAGANTPGREQ